MKLETGVTEQQMRATKVGTPANLEELNTFIQSCLDAVNPPSSDHPDKDKEMGAAYGRAVYAMSMSAVATFNYIASQLGVTGFQASCADLDILSRTRGLVGPFMILDASKLLYPQYNLLGDAQKFIDGEGVKKWLAETAEKSLAENIEHVAAAVIDHWKYLAGQK